MVEPGNTGRFALSTGLDVLCEPFSVSTPLIRLTRPFLLDFRLIRKRTFPNIGL